MTLINGFSLEERGREQEREEEEIELPGRGTILREDRGGGGGGSTTQGNSEQANRNGRIQQDTDNRESPDQGNSSEGQNGSHQPSPSTNRR